ncbi:MAG: glycosyltransferase [Myxococcota bacterium]
MRTRLDQQPSVLHVAQTLLPPSETFIQQRLVGARFRPTAVAWRRDPGGLPVPCPHRILGGRARARLPAPLRSAALHAETFALLARMHPSVVHAHFGPAGLRVDRECRLLAIPLVVSFYGFDVGTLPRDSRIVRRYRELFNEAAAVTAEGPALARKLLDLGAPARTVKLLPLGLPEWALAPPHRAVAWDSKPLRLLQVARFAEKKGIDTTLRALALARRRGAQAELVLAGGGPLEAPLRSLIEELRLSDAVSLPGFVPHDELPRLLSEAHLFVQPSRTASDGDTEGGHPTTLLEAQAQEVPVLGTRHADIPMAVQHGTIGWLVAEDDHEALAEGIVALDRDRARLRRMGEAARSWVLRRHHPERLLKLRERIYRNALRTYASRRSPLAKRVRGAVRDWLAA